MSTSTSSSSSSASSIPPGNAEKGGISSGSQYRSQGNNYFTSGSYLSALECYTKALIHLQLPSPLSSTSPSASKEGSSSSSQDITTITQKFASFSLYDEGEILAMMKALTIAYPQGNIQEYKKDIVTILSNRAATLLKLSLPNATTRSSSIILSRDKKLSLYLQQAIRDCTIGLYIDNTNLKLLYRRSLCNEGLGKLREALTDAGHALQLDKTNNQVIDLLRRLRENQGTPATPSTHPNVTSPSSSSSFSSSTIADSILTLKRITSSSSTTVEDATTSTLQQQQYHEELQKLVKNLQTLIVAPSPVRAFIHEDGPRLLMQAVTSLPASTAKGGNTGGSTVTLACNLVITLSARITEEYHTVWNKEWDTERRQQRLTLSDIIPNQLKLIDMLAGCISPQAVLALTRNGTGSPAPTAAGIRVAASVIAAIYAILRPQLQAMTLERLRQWKAIKEGTLSTIVPLPTSFRTAIKHWSSVVTAVLSTIGPIVNETPGANLVQTCLQSLTYICDCEDSIQLVDRLGLITALTVYTSNDIPDIRRTAHGALSHIFTILRDAHPRGYQEMGRKKIKTIVQRILNSLLKDLALALPMKPDDSKDEKNGKKTKTTTEPTTEDTLFPVPTTLPDWNPCNEYIRTTALVFVSLLVDRDTGLWFCDLPGVLPAVFITCSTSTDNHSLSLGADVIASLCSDETGRSILTTLNQRVISGDPSYTTRLDIMQLLQRLTESSSAAVRASAAVTLTKLTAPSKGFNAPEGEQGRDEMVTTILSLLKAAVGQVDSDAFAQELAAAEENDDDDDDDDNDVIEVVGTNSVINLPPQKKGHRNKSSSSSSSNLNTGKSSLPIPLSSLSSASTLRSPNTSANVPFRYLVTAVKLSWGNHAMEKGLTSMLSETKHTSNDSSFASSSSLSSTALLELAQQRTQAVDLEAAARAIEALAVLSTHTVTKARLVREDCTNPLLAIGATLTSYVDLHRALILDGRAQMDEDSVDAGQTHVIAGKGGVIDVSKVSIRCKSIALRAPLRPTLYGLVHILYSLVISRQRQQEAKLMELDVDIDQWKELQRLATPQGLDPMAGQELDPPNEVEQRTKSLLQSDILHMLISLAEAAKGLPLPNEDNTTTTRSESVHRTNFTVPELPLHKNTPEDKPLPPPVSNTAKHGAATRELISLFLLQLSEWVWARGLMIQAGIIPLLLDLAEEGQYGPSTSSATNPVVTSTSGSVSAVIAATRTVAPMNTQQGSLAAIQALARIFITTNPTLISSAYILDSVRPLVLLAKNGTTSLAQFEAGLALTNLGGISNEIREALLRWRGLQALEYLQFSNHKLVRRAGTEGISNLATTPEGSQLITSSRLGLWISLARSFQPPGAHIADGSEQTVSSVKRRKEMTKKLKAEQKEKAIHALERKEGEKGDNTKDTDGGDKKTENTNDTNEETEVNVIDADDNDTPTAMAAAGGLAMAALHSIPDDEDQPTDDEKRDGEVCVQRFVRGGIVLAMAELLLSGHNGLIHRAITILERLAWYPLGAAALLTPLVSMDSTIGKDDDREYTTNSDSDDDDENHPFRNAAKGLHVFLLLHLLSQGRDIRSMAGTGTTTSTASMITNVTGTTVEPVPPNVAALAKQTIHLVLRHGEGTINQATEKYNSLQREGRVQTQTVLLPKGTSTNNEEISSSESSTVITDESTNSSDTTTTDNVWKLTQVRPVWPSKEFIERIGTVRQ